MNWLKIDTVSQKDRMNVINNEHIGAKYRMLELAWRLRQFYIKFHTNAGAGLRPPAI